MPMGGTTALSPRGARRSASKAKVGNEVRMLTNVNNVRFFERTRPTIAPCARHNR
jgi:hypothetical protein